MRGMKLPKGCKAIESELQALGRAIGHELSQQHGVAQVPLYAMAVQQTATRHELRARLAGRWLRLAPDDLPIETRLALLKAISDASDQRDKCLARLGLEKALTAGGTLADLYESLRQPAAIEGEVVPTKEDEQHGQS